MERNGVKDHGVNDAVLIFDLDNELMAQVAEAIPSHEINNHVVNEMRSLLPLFTEGYGK